MGGGGRGSGGGRWRRIGRRGGRGGGGGIGIHTHFLSAYSPFPGLRIIRNKDGGLMSECGRIRDLANVSFSRFTVDHNVHLDLNVSSSTCIVGVWLKVVMLWKQFIFLQYKNNFICKYKH